MEYELENMSVMHLLYKQQKLQHYPIKKILIFFKFHQTKTNQNKEE